MNNLPLLEDLRLFCAVARNLSFVASAIEVGMSPAYVSKRILLLERTLGVRLLHRTTRQTKLTEHGATAYLWARRILEDAQQMAEEVTSAKVVPRGSLRISSSSGFGRNRVAPVISELASRYPDLQIHLELLDRPVDVIAEGFDLDIRHGRVDEPNLIVKRIAANYRVLCAAPHYLKRFGRPKKLSDLKQHRCIIMRERDQPFGAWQLQGPAGVESIKIRGLLSTNDGDIVLQLALDGHGIILRGMWNVGPKIRSGHLVRIMPEYYQEADVSVVYPHRLTESAKVRVCVQLLAERINTDVLSAW